ncbi:MAG: glycosyl hydrolase [Planctomycetaceae bacterium]|nr:MAG: glycosyl hydrolase [Planctomycetaceae bacterium]
MTLSNQLDYWPPSMMKGTRMIRHIVGMLILAWGNWFLTEVAAQAQDQLEPGFKSLFDGKTFQGWKISENPQSWSIRDGAIVANGPRSHLFYVGDDQPFVNFELKVDVMTHENSNGGIYFHTRFQPEGWPVAGFEVQVNNSYKDPQKTGSLYGVVKIYESPAKDREWFTEHITVKGKNIVVRVNDKIVVDYTEPMGAQPGKDFRRVLDSGTFALQAHDPGSTVYYKNIRVKRLE